MKKPSPRKVVIEFAVDADPDVVKRAVFGAFWWTMGAGEMHTIWTSVEEYKAAQAIMKAEGQEHDSKIAEERVIDSYYAETLSGGYDVYAAFMDLPSAKRKKIRHAAERKAISVAKRSPRATAVGSRKRETR